MPEHEDIKENSGTDALENADTIYALIDFSFDISIFVLRGKQLISHTV